MSNPDENRLPAEFEAIERELRANRAQASGLELDQIKLRAMRQASRGAGFKPLKGAPMRSRLLTLLVAGALLGGTTAGGLAWGGGGEHHGKGGGHEEYCEQHPQNPQCQKPPKCDRAKDRDRDNDCDNEERDGGDRGDRGGDHGDHGGDHGDHGGEHGHGH